MGRAAIVSSTLLLALLSLEVTRTAARPRVHIPDDLDGVVDNEEDDDFAAWGRHADKSGGGDEAGDGGGGHAMDVGEGGTVDVAQLLKKQAAGPQLTFARLVADPTGARTIDDVNALGAKWASLLRSGGMSEKVYGIDENTVLMSLTDGAIIDEVREFLWLQDEVDEFEWNQQVWRRGSDQPQPPKPKAAPPVSAEKVPKKKRGKRIKGKKSRRPKEVTKDAEL